MPVSHLDNSVAEILAFGLNEATGESYSHLTTSEDQMLALLVSEMTGQEYSHLTTGRETLWELLLTQAAADGITFDRNTQSNEQIAAIIANNVSAGGGEEYEGLLDIVGGSIVAVSSARALSAAMLEQPAYTLQKLDGGAQPTQAFSYEADGTIDGAAVVTFLDGNDGGVTLWNDHSGNALDFFSENSPIWSLNAPNKPLFTATGNQKAVVEFDIAGGVRSYGLVVGYTENEDGTQFFLHTSEFDSARVHCKSFWNVANDIWVDVISSDGLTTARWATSATLTTGVHLIELQFDVSGNLVLLIDGVDASASLQSGSLVALPAITDGYIDLPANSTGALDLYEYYIWPQQNIGATGRADIKTFFGIA